MKAQTLKYEKAKGILKEPVQWENTNFPGDNQSF
jgi:hypothetical protein